MIWVVAAANPPWALSLSQLWASGSHTLSSPHWLLSCAEQPSVQWNKAGNQCSWKTSLPLPLCWAQLGRVPRSGSFCGCISSMDKLRGKCSGLSGTSGQGRGCSGCLNTCLALPPNVKTWPQFLLDLWSTKDLKEIWATLTCEAELTKVHNWHY